MKSVEDKLESLSRILVQEIQLLGALAERERILQSHLLERDWQELQKVIDQMAALSEEIQQAEGDRERCFSTLSLTLGLNDTASFSELISRLDEQSAGRLRALYRSLKVAVMRIRSLTGGIDAYVASSTATMRSFLEECSPAHRGTIYRKDGNAGATGAHAVVVDRHL
ncbi:MAG: hypothetical protein EA384_04870 [Spirochaetaceae bacterium]|nr:MAG: hypothetical protein EA384_04870 [Spirochaetaceae bacterium]